jgi:hypothetical protein
MLSLKILAVGLALAGFTEAQYLTGPRGGCYTLTKTGTKRYVDRTLCEPRAQLPTTQQPKVKPNSSSSENPSQFIRGPRGGCYKLTANGTKLYVDRAFCR